MTLEDIHNWFFFFDKLLYICDVRSVRINTYANDSKDTFLIGTLILTIRSCNLKNTRTFVRRSIRTFVIWFMTKLFTGIWPGIQIRKKKTNDYKIIAVVRVYNRYVDELKKNDEEIGNVAEKCTKMRLYARPVWKYRLIVDPGPEFCHLGSIY